MTPIGRYRASRIWNINGNIIIASLVAILLTGFTIDLLDPMYEHIAITLLLTALIDLLYDAAVFTILHALTTSRRVRFVRDVGLIQTQRLFLSPLFYLIAVPGQAFLLMFGFTAATSLLAYAIALVITRGAHTTYGIWTGLFDR